MINQNEETLKFKISSNLKSIIGKDLINDKFVAIFELVKNSYDAGAKKVTITFIKGDSIVEPKIVISDDGCGMSKDDLINKFLFVAYSEKKKENQDPSENYRKRFNRVYAGAKGVGRFSCDRLGRILELKTWVDYESEGHQINIDWMQFEVDDKSEFIDVGVKYKIIEKQKHINSGTDIIIRGLRESWNREDLLTLKRSLMKLTSPMDEDTSFEIELIAIHELVEDNKIKRDNKESDYNYSKVNGIIVNDVIRKINEKTTSVIVKINEDGSVIESSLFDRGNFIFMIQERNTYDKLRNIECEISYLNSSAKTNFTRKMGIQPVNYGSIFIYKNEIRIYPFGEPGQDFLEINRRKAQGYNRYFGTRELLGNIRIKGDNYNFEETTSRDGGFIRNSTIIQFEDFFYKKILNLLEKYVVEGVKWAESGEGVELQFTDVKDHIITQFASIIDKNDIIKVNINQDIIQTNENDDQDKLKEALTKLKKAVNSNYPSNLSETISIFETEISKLENEKKMSILNLQKSIKDFNEVKGELIQRSKQSKLLEKKIDKDVLSLEKGYHLIIKYSDALTNQLESLDDDTNHIYKDQINYIHLLNNRIKMHSEIQIRSNYKHEELFRYNLIDYLKDLIKYNIFNNSNYERLSITLTQNDIAIFTKIPKEDISIIFDNIISNSVKAKAKNLLIQVTEFNKTIEMDFVDDGIGLSKEIHNIDSIFETSFSTTNGMGLGLSHIKAIIDDYKGQVKYIKSNSGFHIKVVVKR